MTAESVCSRFNYLRQRKTTDTRPTQLQIQSHVNRNKAYAPLLDKLDNHIPPDVIQRTILDGDAFLWYKFDKLRASIQRIIEDHGREALSKLDQSCIKKDGRINIKKFRIKLNGQVKL